MRRLLSSSKVHPPSFSTPFCHSERLREFTVTVILEIFYQGSRPIFYKYNEKRRSLQTKYRNTISEGLVSVLRSERKHESRNYSYPQSSWWYIFVFCFARISVFKNIEGFSFHNTLLQRQFQQKRNSKLRNICFSYTKNPIKKNDNNNSNDKIDNVRKTYIDLKKTII